MKCHKYVKSVKLPYEDQRQAYYTPTPIKSSKVFKSETYFSSVKKMTINKLDDSQTNISLPAKNGEGHGENKSLNSNSCTESMKRSVVGVSIAGFSDGEPGVMRIKPCEFKSRSDGATQRGDKAWGSNSGG